jgi:hypothetical protein
MNDTKEVALFLLGKFFTQQIVGVLITVVHIGAIPKMERENIHLAV